MNGSNRRHPGIFGLGLILTLVALYAFVLAEPSSSAAQSPSIGDKVGKENAIAATQDPHRLAPPAVNEASSAAVHPSVLAGLKVVAPVSTGVGCTNCHCGTNNAATKYLAGSTGGVKANDLTLQDFLRQGQYVPLLEMKRSVFCTSPCANLPGYKFEDLLRFLRLEKQPGT
jgi:hypothetical protein